MKGGSAIFAARLALGLAVSQTANATPPATVRAEAQAAAFIDRLYAYYRVEPSRPRDESAVWTPAMLALMARLNRLDDEAQLEVSGGDEICQCQDWGQFQLLARRIELHGPNRADVFVRFRNLGRMTGLKLLLERTPSGWRVADVFAPDRAGGLAAAYRQALGSRSQP